MTIVKKAEKYGREFYDVTYGENNTKLNENDLIFYNNRYITIKEMQKEHGKNFPANKKQFEYFLQFYLVILSNRKK